MSHGCLGHGSIRLRLGFHKKYPDRPETKEAGILLERQENLRKQKEGNT